MLVAPEATLAQSAVAAASSIRVVEIVDPWTGERIRIVAEDLTASEISRIQRALASAGFDPGRATGRLDSATLLAVGRFQASRGLFWCDCVTYETILALRIRPFLVASIRAPIEGLWYGSDILVLAPHHGFLHGSAVVVGHSPGGLLTKLMVVDGELSWLEEMLGTPFEELDLSVEQQQLLRSALDFDPLPFVQRVIFLSTPHHGSDLADRLFARFINKLIAIPGELTSFTDALARNEAKLSTVEALKLRSMMWTVDSMDWADPVP